MGSTDEKPDYEYEKNTEIRIYALEDGHTATSLVYGMDNEVKLEITATRTGDRIAVNVTGKETYSLRLVNERATSAGSYKVTTQENDSVIEGIQGNVEVLL